ncbi:MAG: amidohydrolase [Bacteroidales bacterium]|nr:amidohydrolase [Bacteroidales bacterium]
MNAIFIKNVLLNNDVTNILIEDRHIAQIGEQIMPPAEAVTIDGTSMAAFPTFANMHTHAAMNLFRGYANDLPLMTWLNDWIWPKEKNLDDDIIYWGTRLACTEMIKSGTTAFSDMYFHIPAAARAAYEMGIRGTLGITVFGDADDLTEAVIEDTLRTLEPYQELINIAIAPHAVYTVSEKGLKRCAEMAKKYGLLYHIHMSETQNEVDNCLKQYACRPYELLERLGILDLTEGHFSGAHSLYVDDNEIAIMGHHHITATHNPCSNLKLGSGHFFRYTELRDAGVNVTLGTDGCSSSNNLDMIEAAKFMSYLQKGVRQDPTVLPASELLQVATQNGFQTLGIDAGAIETGRCADLMLVSLDNLAFVPNNDTLANLFYAAHGDAVDTVICNGIIVMQNRAIPSEEETIREARRATQKLLK